jgi:hypothetical protein
MNPIHNPFSRDEHPDLTAAILGVVNESHTRAQLEKKSTTELRALRKTHASKGAKADSRSAETLAHIHGILRSRGAGAALDEDLQTPERAAEMGARKKKAARHSADAMKRNPEGAGTAAIVNSEIDLHIKDKRERDSKKTYGAGGKVVRESASPQGGDKKPFNPFNPTLGDLLPSKQQDKKAPKGKTVKEAVTAAQQKVFARERERMLNALNNPKQKLSPTEREAVLARGARNAAAETRKGAVSPTGEKSPIHSAAKAHHEYARRESKKLDAIVQRKVHEDIQTPERAEQQRKRIKSAERGVIFGSRYGRADRTGRLRQLQRIDAREKADTKTTWGVSEPHHIRGHDESTPRKRRVQEDYQTPARERQMKRKIKRAEHRSDAGASRYMQALDAEAKTADTNPKAEKAVRAAGKAWNTAIKKSEKLYTTQRKEEMSKRLYGAGGKMLKRKVQEGAQLDERIIDEVDFFQASKNLLTGKGFKTNREVSGARVNANMAAMQRRKARAAKKTK